MLSRHGVGAATLLVVLGGGSAENFCVLGSCPPLAAAVRLVTFRRCRYSGFSGIENPAAPFAPGSRTFFAGTAEYLLCLCVAFLKPDVDHGNWRGYEYRLSVDPSVGCKGL